MTDDIEIPPALAAEVEPWLQECGSCDAGLPMACTCPPGDYRNILLKVWRAYEATAAEVKVLTETASKVAYELGRKDAGEEIAAALMRENNLLESLPKDEPAVNQQARSAVIFRGSAFRDGAKIARDITAQPQNAASDAISVPSEGPGTSEPSKAAKTPQGDS